MMSGPGTAVCHCNMLRGCPPPPSGPAWNTLRASPATGGALVRQGKPGRIGAHFFLATYWQDLAAVKAFAGEDYHVAVTYPDDEAFELLSDPYVFQHEVEVVSPL
ncbi:antibiotic biosynthesis monooxygenase [Klebsiella pneumoniae]|uniref:Antibiotic biosynthesis monooxygenase n=1 Tax=Klebsiella pneumoniae TaxID=573 RepID=A0A4P0Y3S9_KLEPN|nr:antibiotic biosynthesis monooxygenase [Klebsiella pneumoniae]